MSAFGFSPLQRRKLLGEIFCELWNTQIFDEGFNYIAHWCATGEIETMSDFIEKMDFEMEAFIDDPERWSPYDEITIGAR